MSMSNYNDSFMTPKNKRKTNDVLLEPLFKEVKVGLRGELNSSYRKDRNHTDLLLKSVDNLKLISKMKKSK